MMRRELLFAFLFVIFAGFAFFPLLLVALGSYDGDVFAKIEALIFDRQELLISLGTLFLVLGLSVWSGHLANRSAEKRDEANRLLQAELKVADFRQAWINDLRNELEEFSQITFSSPKDRAHDRHSALLGKIRMRLNLSEAPARELYSAMLHAAKHNHADMAEEAAAFSLLSEKGHAFLRSEWNRMKKDIRDALTFAEKAE